VEGEVGEEDRRLLSLQTGEDPVVATDLQPAQKLDAPPLLRHPTEKPLANDSKENPLLVKIGQFAGTSKPAVTGVSEMRTLPALDLASRIGDTSRFTLF
jgi:hypothetical protein